MIRQVVALLREVIDRGAPDALSPLIRRPPGGASTRVYPPPGARNPLRRALGDQRAIEQMFVPSAHRRASIGQVSYPAMRQQQDAALSRRNPATSARRSRRFREPQVL